MNCLRRHTYWHTEDFIGEGCSSGEQQGKGTQENCSAAWLAASGFLVVGLAFPVVSGQSSCLGPYLVRFKALPGGMGISQSKWFPAGGFLGGWQDILWAGISSFLLTPPKFFRLATACQFPVLIGTSCSETTHAVVIIMPGQGRQFWTMVP